MDGARDECPGGCGGLSGDGCGCPDPDDLTVRDHEVRLEHPDGSKRTVHVEADSAEEAEARAIKGEPAGTIPHAFGTMTSLSQEVMWADRIRLATKEWQRCEGLPDQFRMDRAMKAAGFRDVIRDNQLLREAQSS